MISPVRPSSHLAQQSLEAGLRARLTGDLLDLFGAAERLVVDEQLQRERPLLVQIEQRPAQLALDRLPVAPAQRAVTQVTDGRQLRGDRGWSTAC